MRSRALVPLVPISIATAYHLAPRVEQSLEGRATYQGAWALYLAGACPSSYSTPCGDKTNVNQVCCPTGNTCHGGLSYCCPTAQDCQAYVNNFPTCVDPSSNMFAWADGFFCCAQGQTGVKPVSGFPFCQSNDVAVPVSIQATMISQFGGTSVTPFGGYGTVAPGSTGSITGSPATTTATISKSTTSPLGSTPTSTASSSIAGSQLATPVYIGIGVGAVVLIAFIYGIYKCCIRRITASSYKKPSYTAGPSVLSGYVNHGYVPAHSSQPLYYPPPYQPGYQTAYDPVMESGTLPMGATTGSRAQTSTVISPLASPPPARSPLPEYGFKDEPDGRGQLSPLSSGAGAGGSSIELLALDDPSRERAEMPVVGGRRVELSGADTASERVEMG